MDEIELEIKNYRCFSDNMPLRIKIGGGNITALVGPNNSGKSSLLRFFYEMKNLWSSLRDKPTFLRVLRCKKHGAGPNQVEYGPEIFCDSNSREITISIHIINPTIDTEVPALSSLKLVGDRDFNWLCSFCGFTSGLHSRNFERMADNGLFVDDTGSSYSAFNLFNILNCLSNVMYIGPFRNTINVGAGEYYDLLIGSAFANTWSEWKTGVDKSRNQLIQRVTEDIRRIFSFDRLEINATPDMKALQVIVNNKPYRLKEMGAGIAQFIHVLASAAIRKPSLILIDEPELNLHPSLQIDFLQSLASYCTDGVVFATHSIGLARSVADCRYSLRKVNDGIDCRELSETRNYAEFLGEMSFSAYKELGFEQVLLVEGVKDVKVAHEFLKKVNKDHKVVVIPLGGDAMASGGVELEMGELKRITENISAWVDSERECEGAEPINKRVEFEKLCKKLDFNICITKLRATENYFSESAIQKIYGEKCHKLPPYSRPKDMGYSWNKSDNWRLAQATDWNDLKDTDVGRFFKSL